MCVGINTRAGQPPEDIAGKTEFVGADRSAERVQQHTELASERCASSKDWSRGRSGIKTRLLAPEIQAVQSERTFVELSGWLYHHDVLFLVKCTNFQGI